MNENILLIWDRMGDYHRARWSALQNEVPNVKVFGADLGNSDAMYGWKSTERHELYIKLSDKSADRFDIKRVFKFINVLNQHKIQTICIPGYGKFIYLFYLMYGKIMGKRIILFAESWYPSLLLTDFLKSFFLKRVCDGFLVSGVRAKNHFRNRLKVSPDLIKIGYSVVDNAHFSTIKEKSNEKKKFRMLCVARFVPEKNLEYLIHSFVGSELLSKNWELVIVGGGPLHSSLKQLVHGSPILILPWQPYDKLPELYQSADLFVLTSCFEPWGLVVNEAMAAGLPIVLANQVGCLPDLLSDRNGWSFDGDELISIFNDISDRTADLPKMGIFSRQIIEKYSLSFFARNLASLINVQ